MKNIINQLRQIISFVLMTAVFWSVLPLMGNAQPRQLPSTINLPRKSNIEKDTSPQPKEKLKDNSKSPSVAERLAFITNRDGNVEIYGVNDDGTSLANLSNSAGFIDFDHDYNATNGKIVYYSYSDETLKTMNADGSNKTTLIASSYSGSEPNWSPNGNFIVYIAQNSSFNTTLNLFNVAANTNQVLLDDANITQILSPKFSPDGTKIVFYGTTDNREVFLINSDGTGLLNLTNSAATDEMRPQWSPDGTKIVFDDSADVFVMNSDGTSTINLTNSVDNLDRNQRFSPDGTKIAFDSFDIVNSTQNIVVMDANGTSPQVLQSGELPNWSLAGDKIAFYDYNTGIVRAMTSAGVLLAVNETSEVYHDDPPIWIGAATGTPNMIGFELGESTNAEDATNVSVVVKRLGDSSVAASVNYATSDGTATSPADYTSVSGTLNFAIGETSKSIIVPIIDDTDFEELEDFTITLSNPSSGFFLAQSTHSVRIDINDFTSIQFSSTNYLSVNENAGTIDLEVTRTGVLTGVSSVSYGTYNLTATSPADYIHTTGTLTFAAGETSKIIQVPIVDDSTFEPNQRFGIILSSFVGAISGFPDRNIIDIIDNDAGIQFQFANENVEERSSNTSYNIAVTRTGVTTGISTVDYAIVPTIACDGVGGSNCATAGSDYVQTTGTITFSPNQTLKFVSVTILPDSEVEDFEDFSIVLSNAIGSPLAPISRTNIRIDQNDVNIFSVQVANNPVTENEGLVTVTVNKTANVPNTLTSTVDYQTVNGTATSVQDYSSRSGTLTFLPSEISKSFTIPIINDTVGEFDENFLLSFTNARGGGSFASGGSHLESITISGNDQASVRAISPPNVAENVGSVEVQISRTLDLNIPTTVNYATFNSSAIAGSDYTAVSGTLSFAAGEVSKTVTIPILNDTVYETPSNETFSLVLSNPSSGTVLGGNATVTIIDDEIRYKMTNFLSLSVSEGVGMANISVTKLDGFSLETSVNYDTLNGTAISTQDFAGGIETLTFLPGESVKNLSIPIVQDVASEQTETFTVRLLASSNAIINSPSTKLVEILDDDPKIAMEFSSANVSETDGTIALKILRIGPTDLTASVNYSTANDTAIAGSDYTSVSGTATFNAGESEKIISVPILVDSIPETDQSFSFLLSNPNGAILQSPTFTTITIREPVTTFSLSKTKPECAIQTYGQNSSVICSDYSPKFRWEYVETTGTSGTFAYWSRYFDFENQTTQSVTVTRSGGRINEAASVNYTTSNGTAISGEDFTSVSGTLDFAPNEVSKTFDVPILNDSIGEGYEYLNITLSSPTNQHTLDKSTVRMGILDSYVGFTSFDNNGTQIEHPDYGDFETAAFGSVPVYRLGDTSNALTINYLTANGTATPDLDYTSTSGTLTFAAGETVKYIDVPILNQPELEGTENFEIQLSDVVGDGSLVGNLTNFSIYETFAYIPCYQPSDRTTLVDCRYGDYRNIVTPESAANVQVKVRVNGERNGVITVDYATSDETATAGSDYSATNGTLTFAVNESEKFITVPILNDSIAESDETFKVTLSNFQGSGGLLESNSVSTIKIQDACVRFNAGSVSETNSQTTVVVARQCDTASALTVGYSTADDTAIAGQDYTATSGTVTFAAGETSKSFTIPILDDNILEQPEKINLVMNLSGTEAVQHPQSSTFVQINESLSTVSVGITALSVDENAGFYTAAVSRSGNVNHSFSVDYTTLDGTAIAGSDYTSVSGTLNFAAGELQKTFQVPILNDLTDEANETFIVSLSNLTGETIFANASRSISIIDDDTAPKFKFQFPSFTINEAGGNGQIRVVRTGDPTTAVSVNVATSNGTATAGNDYTTTSTTLNFAANETVKAFNVPILDDAVTEGNEYLNLTLSSPIGGTIETPNPVRLNISEIKPQVQLPNWTLNVVSSGGLLSGRHLAGIAFNSTNKDVYVATDTGQLQNTEELYFDLFKIDASGNQTQIGNYLIPHYDLVNLEFNPTDGQIYVAGTDKFVYRINPTNGAVSVFNSNLGVTFFRNGLEFNAAGELIFMPEGNPNSFYRVNAGSGLTLLGNVIADNNSNYGTRFGIQPDGDYVIYPDGDAASNPRITQVKPNDFAFSYLSPTNVRTLGSAFGHSIGAINPLNGDVYSSGGNFGNGSSVILYTNGTSSFAANQMSGNTVPFVTNIGNNLVDGQNNLSAKGVVDMEFGVRRDNQNGQCLYFADDVDETIYQACQLFAPTASTVSVGGRVLTDANRGFMNATVTITDSNGQTRTTRTNSFGYFRFNEVMSGQSYVLSVKTKRYRYSSQVVTVDEQLDNITFSPENLKIE